ncbi:hypothetical protein FAM21835_02084 [Lentilactobacillus parabuchneri]|uniref:DUF3383 family protein n=1 Tax=Lentilactobacillus parabuchneri TaxID=152331 RepID=UPI000A0F6F5C|nr:DUF3383 family protein [Lentilactobacillus parabuchneri]ORN25106.1 hypothetical protein FAM21835_02084 [Lentilactobacillus parabuchneri]
MANSDNLIAAVKKFYNSGDEYLIPVGIDKSKIPALSNYIEAQNTGLLLVDVDDIADTAPYASNVNTAAFKANTDTDHANVLSSGTVGAVSALPVGSFDIANTSGLDDSVLPQDQLSFQQDQLVPYSGGNINTYYFAQGMPIVRDGKTLSGDYIDMLLGRDFIIKHSNKKLTEIMVKNPKISYDNTGINLLKSGIESVFDQLYRNGGIGEKDNGKPDYTVTALPREDMKDTDVSQRIYRGLSWQYHPADAIDDVYISGEIDL